MTPKVSIVTCSHNRPELLREAVESLRAQTDPDWEHLINDDASTDKRVPEVLKWAKRDPRVRVWQGQVNLDRPSVLWNYMLDRAHGRYFTVLDDDNKKLPTFVEAMSRELDNDPNLDVITCGWRVDRSEQGKSDEDYFLNLSTSAERLASLSTCDGGAMLYRRESFERAGYFSEALRTNEDWDWFRRALHGGRVKNLHDVHVTYRSHDASRMTRAQSLGNDSDIVRVKERRLNLAIGINYLAPSGKRLTGSQRDVCASVKAALSSISWAITGRDLTLIVSPFQQTNEEIIAVARKSGRILSLHMEDPYALGANLERVRHMAMLRETWVCTNDASTVPYYRKIVGDHVIVCPSLSADDSVPSEQTDRDIDVLLCGYAYPSRKKFVAELLPMLKGLRVQLVGDKWDDMTAILGDTAVMPTQPLSETYRLHARARAVVCLHRIHGDCSDGPVEPETVNRGFMEGYSGARVFLDRYRSCHALDEDDVVWYEKPHDLAKSLRTYLAAPGESSNNFAEKCRRLYTYRTRLVRIINCVRSPRYLAEIT